MHLNYNSDLLFGVVLLGRLLRCALLVITDYDTQTSLAGVCWVYNLKILNDIVITIIKLYILCSSLWKGFSYDLHFVYVNFWASELYFGLGMRCTLV